MPPVAGIVNPLPLALGLTWSGVMAHDTRPDGETDMTADNIAPEDVPPRDPANTEVRAHDGHERQTTGRETTQDEQEDE